MTPTDMTRKHVISAYVRPARERGEDTVEVRVGTVLKELGWSNRTPSVFSTLNSKVFQTEAGLELVEKRGGPSSGGPSTTWQFTYRILPEPGLQDTKERTGPSGSRLMALYGLCANTFKALGGGEAFLKRERQWGPDAWERYGAELAKEKATENDR